MYFLSLNDAVVESVIAVHDIEGSMPGSGQKATRQAVKTTNIDSFWLILIYAIIAVFP